MLYSNTIGNYRFSDTFESSIWHDIIIFNNTAMVDNCFSHNKIFKNGILENLGEICT